MPSIPAKFIPVNVACVRKSFSQHFAQGILASAQLASDDKKIIYFNPDQAFWKQKGIDLLAECKDDSSVITVPEQFAPAGGPSISSSDWGPKKWAEFHAKKNPTLSWLNNEFIPSLPLGCGCKKDFKDDCARNPPPPDDAPLVYWQWWGKDRHDSVNVRLKHFTFTDADAIAKYGWEPRPS